MTKYTEFLKKWARVNNFSYMCGRDQPDFKEAWAREKAGLKPVKGSKKVVGNRPRSNTLPTAETMAREWEGMTLEDRKRASAMIKVGIKPPMPHCECATLENADKGELIVHHRLPHHPRIAEMSHRPTNNNILGEVEYDTGLDYVDVENNEPIVAVKRPDFRKEAIAQEKLFNVGYTHPSLNKFFTNQSEGQKQRLVEQEKKIDAKAKTLEEYFENEKKRPKSSRELMIEELGRERQEREMMGEIDRANPPLNRGDRVRAESNALMKQMGWNWGIDEPVAKPVTPPSAPVEKTYPPPQVFVGRMPRPPIGERNKKNDKPYNKDAFYINEAFIHTPNNFRYRKPEKNTPPARLYEIVEDWTQKIAILSLLEWKTKKNTNDFISDVNANRARNGETTITTHQDWGNGSSKTSTKEGLDMGVLSLTSLNDEKNYILETLKELVRDIIPKIQSLELPYPLPNKHTKTNNSWIDQAGMKTNAKGVTYIYDARSAKQYVDWCIENLPVEIHRSAEYLDEMGYFEDDGVLLK